MLTHPKVFAFACSIAGRFDGHETIYNCTSRGQAKHMHYLNVSDPWPDVRYIDVRARKIGAPHTSADFVRNAAYRGMPYVQCGVSVKVGDQDGVIVGHNASANFDVLFHTGKHKGIVMNVHPSEVKVCC